MPAPSPATATRSTAPERAVTHRFTSPETTRLGLGLLVASATLGVIITGTSGASPVATLLGLVSTAGLLAVAAALLLIGRTGITVRGGTLYGWTHLRRHRIPLSVIASVTTTPTGISRDGLAVAAHLNDGRTITFTEPVSWRSATGIGTTPAEKAATRLTHLLARRRAEAPGRREAAAGL